jgi:hypothetical protein
MPGVSGVHGMMTLRLCCWLAGCWLHCRWLEGTGVHGSIPSRWCQDTDLHSL